MISGVQEAGRKGRLSAGEAAWRRGYFSWGDWPGILEVTFQLKQGCWKEPASWRRGKFQAAGAACAKAWGGKKALAGWKKEKENRKQHSWSLVRKGCHEEDACGSTDQRPIVPDLGVHSKDNGEPRKNFKLVNVRFQFTFETIPLDGSRVDWVLGDHVHAVPVVQGSNMDGQGQDGGRQDRDTWMNLRCVLEIESTKSASG